MTRTFVDAGVITRAVRSQNKEMLLAAIELLESGSRRFLASPFLIAETLPHSQRIGNVAEQEWLTAYFSRCEAISDLERILEGARTVILELPLGLTDALHISAARLLDADEFITTEGGRKKAQSAALFGIRKPAVVKLRR